MLPPYLMPHVLKLIPNASAPHIRMPQMNLVDKPHQLKIVDTDRYGFIIKA
jgi:hypothetical protein